MLRVSEVSHAYGRLESLRSVSLQVETGEIVCLLGPSGCGKTTLLRIIAGLEENYRGQVTLDGQDIGGAPAHQRGFGLMFQDFALFPHMSVADNVAYGLRRRGVRASLIRQQVAGLLEKVGLAGMGARDIASLSGGQKQRVALARSLAPRPRLLMLDEPLGSLDAQLRDQLALELRGLIKEQGLSAIYVTHDHREAYAVADRIAVMDVGSIEQVDTPLALYRRPGSAFVARFLGMRNVYAINHSRFIHELSRRAMAGANDGETVLIHPSGIRLGGSPASRTMLSEAVLQSIVFRGDYYDVSANAGGDTMLSFAASQVSADVGATVTVAISLDAVMTLRR
ncbi:MAG: ABC transporter ATP-binding protein [Chloroflexi bacterium]|nr:ABC transporter ATP-binding protein [Chloroflexota bacterium]